MIALVCIMKWKRGIKVLLYIEIPYIRCIVTVITLVGITKLKRGMKVLLYIENSLYTMHCRCNYPCGYNENKEGHEGTTVYWESPIYDALPRQLPLWVLWNQKGGWRYGFILRIPYIQCIATVITLVGIMKLKSGMKVLLYIENPLYTVHFRCNYPCGYYEIKTEDEGTTL